METIVESVTNGDADNSNSAIKNSNEKTNKGPKKPFKLDKFLRSLISMITVEPYLLLYVTATVISSIAMHKLKIDKACRVDLNRTEKICSKLIDRVVNDIMTLRTSTEVSTLVGDMNVFIDPLMTWLPAIFMLFVGAWSDKTGNRKALLLTPLIGEIVSIAGLLLATYYFREWPVWVIGLIQIVPTIFTGGLPVVFMASYSYIADVTTPESRTFRIGIVALMALRGLPVGSYLANFFIEKNVSYYVIFGISLALNIIALIYTLFKIQDVRRTKIEGTFINKLIHFFHPKNVWETLSMLFISREKKLVQILLVIWAHIVIAGPVSDLVSNLYHFAAHRYNMNIMDYSWFNKYSLVIGITGNSIAITLFTKWLKMHDTMLGLIATVSRVTSFLVYGFGPTRDYLYAGPVLDIFGDSGVIAIKSLGTKIVEPHQVGTMFCVIGFINAIIEVLYYQMNKTISSSSEAKFFFGSVMTAPNFLIFILLYLIHRKEQRDIVQHPEIKEIHVYENDVTAL